jgi:hypothetical protein
MGAGMVVLISAAVPVVGSSAPAFARSCSSTSQSISVSHNKFATTMTINLRRCGRSYRSWARYSDGHNVKGSWRTAAGAQSVSYDPNGGNQAGGYQWEPTGGNATQIRTVETY